MAKLNTDPNVATPDDLYQQFIGMHEGLSDADSMKLNAKLILLLANHIGEPVVMREAIAIAKAGFEQN
ncbi:DUF2783 domain-containing protein [Parasphingorhabdus sp.]|uniref:DUF2783 domain-containing protein n=1 Tax=Parasphingorhabdus sp. TaxID=2709688 RepID=UPI00326634F1